MYKQRPSARKDGYGWEGGGVVVGNEHLHRTKRTSSDRVLVVLDGVAVGCGESGRHGDSMKRDSSDGE